MGNPAGVKRDFPKMEKRRLAAVKLYEKGTSQSDIARNLGVCKQAVSQWIAKYKSGGIEAVKWNKKIGQSKRLTPEQLLSIKKAILEGPLAHGWHTDLWTTARVAVLIENMTGVKYHPGHVWRILTEDLNLSPQRPIRKALERDEEKIKHWRKYKWPALKKKPLKKEGP
jgi:transposase